MPLLAAILAWQRGGGAGSAQKGWLTASVIVGYFAVLPVLRVGQIANPDWRMIDWLLAGGCVAALLALVFRLGGSMLLSRCWFPICFLLTAVPWSTSAERTFTAHAVPATASLASEVLWLAGIAALDDGATLRTAVGTIGVSEDCSGIRGFQLAVMAALFWGGFFGLKKGRIILMFLGGIALALLLNVLRVAVIVGAAVRAGQIATADRLHDPAGTVSQIALMLVIPMFGWWLQRGVSRPDEVAQPKNFGFACPEKIAVVPVWAALGAVLWCGASEVAAENWFRTHEARSLSSAPRWTIQRAQTIPGSTEAQMPAAIRENYRYSDGQVLDWKDANGAAWKFFWLDFEKGALSACTHNIHRPETCLPAHDFALARNYPELVVDVGGVNVGFHHQLYQRRGQVLHLFFITAQDIGATGQQTETDWDMGGRIRAAVQGLRSQHSQMVHLLLDAPSSAEEARRLATEYLRKLLMVEGTKTHVGAGK